MSHKQGFRVELAPDDEQAVLMGRHCGLSRVVENFCLETVCKKWSQRTAEQSYGITGDDLTTVPWSAPGGEALLLGLAAQLEAANPWPRTTAS